MIYFRMVVMSERRSNALNWVWVLYRGNQHYEEAVCRSEHSWLTPNGAAKHAHEFLKITGLEVKIFTIGRKPAQQRFLVKIEELQGDLTDGVRTEKLLQEKGPISIRSKHQKEVLEQLKGWTVVSEPHAVTNDMMVLRAPDNILHYLHPNGLIRPFDGPPRTNQQQEELNRLARADWRVISEPDSSGRMIIRWGESVEEDFYLLPNGQTMPKSHRRRRTTNQQREVNYLTSFGWRVISEPNEQGIMLLEHTPRNAHKTTEIYCLLPNGTKYLKL